MSVYIEEYPVVHHPMQQSGEQSIFNSYLNVVVEQMESLEALLEPLWDATDADDLVAFAFISDEYNDLFSQWFDF